MIILYPLSFLLLRSHPLIYPFSVFSINDPIQGQRLGSISVGFPVASFPGMNSQGRIHRKEFPGKNPPGRITGNGVFLSFENGNGSSRLMPVFPGVVPREEGTGFLSREFHSGACNVYPQPDICHPWRRNAGFVLVNKSMYSCMYMFHS